MFLTIIIDVISNFVNLLIMYFLIESDVLCLGPLAKKILLCLSLTVLRAARVGRT